MATAQDKLQEWISGSDNIVFFGGAGVSTESGIPDFRSVDGLYHQQYDYPPETILSEGDVMGCVLFAGTQDSLTATEVDYKLVQTVSGFLGRHMES